MCGPRESILGIEPGIIVRKFITGLPERFILAKGASSLQGALVRAEASTGKALSIATFNRDCRAG
jgi:2',3'-cyclic-nucleotide 2'-phosphodiesterase